MSSKVMFTPEEDMRIWRFGMEKHEGYGSGTMWELFMTKVATTRSPGTLNARFKTVLLPHLINTKFHTETKLRLLEMYRISIDKDFYMQLIKEADINLNANGIITDYRLHPGVRPNFDRSMSDAEFIETMVPITPKQNRFSPEEDEQIWQFISINYEKYTKGSETFWRKHIDQVKSTRSPNVYLQRFNKFLLPRLHKTQLSIETKLKLYKKLQCPVDVDFLKILHSYADLQLGQNGTITDYQMHHQNGSQKRKTKEEAGTSSESKKPRAPEAREASPDVMILTNPKEERTVTYFEQEGKTEEEDYQNYGYEEPEDQNLGQEHLQMDYDQDLHLQNHYQNPYLQNLGAPAIASSSDQDRVISEIDKMKDDLEQKLNVLARSMRKSLDRRVSEVSRSVSSMHHEMKGEMQNMRKELKTGLQDQSNGPSRNMREYLLNLKKLISSLESPDMESVEQRIDSALLNYPEGDETQVPIRVVKSAFDAGLTMIGH